MQKHVSRILMVMNKNRVYERMEDWFLPSFLKLLKVAYLLVFSAFFILIFR